MGPSLGGRVTTVGIVLAIGLSILSWLLARLGVISYLKGKKIAAANQPFPSAESSRCPVVYLRSFEHDAATAKPMGDGPPGTEFNYLSLATEEEQLASAMSEIGPFVALGRPGEELPEIGAHRLYAQQDEWQKQVSSLLSGAQLVVIRLGLTEGLVWELEAAVGIVKPERLLLLVPWSLQYEAFWKRYARVFPAGLPEHLGSRWFPIDRIRSVIYFGADWTPQFVRLKFSRRYSGTTLLRASLKIALAPIVKRLGLEFEPLVGLPTFVYIIGVFVGVVLLSAVLHICDSPSS